MKRPKIFTFITFRKEAAESLETFYPDIYPIQLKSMDKLIEDAFEFMSTQMNRGGRVVIMTNEYNRVGSTLAMAYLIAGEGKSLKVRFTSVPFEKFVSQ
ncbi:hypothetical protein TSMEX_001045 [Taenia solium]|eukprot:TsM_000979800 transcript=TsM_000979800 gene=TsM_000979800